MRVKRSGAVHETVLNDELRVDLIVLEDCHGLASER